MTIVAERESEPERAAQPDPGREPSRSVGARAAGFVLPARDVRRKRPPLLAFLLRLETLRRVVRVASLLLVDYAAIWAAIFTALAVRAAAVATLDFDAALQDTRRTVPFAFLLTVLLFARSQLYAERAQRAGFARITASLTQVMLVALVYAILNGEEYSSYYIFYGSLFFAVVYVAVARRLYDIATELVLRAAGYERRAILVGSGRHLEQVAHALGSDASPIRLVGYLSLTPRPDNGLPSLGTLDRLPEVLSAQRVQEVIIADPDFPEQHAVELVDLCHRRGVRVRVAPSTTEVLAQRAEFIPGQSVPLFEVKPPVFEGIDFLVKRSFDLICSVGLLVLLSPVLAACALAVKLTSRGPLLYPSMRPGIGGTPFACLKFRTMYADADRRQAELEALNESSGALFKIRDDPRVTPAGRVLRRFSLDELPQLINVVRGEMSLVGPRPLPLRDFERLEEWHKKRYLVLPGITGLWQVSGRSDLDFDDLVRLDFLYLERWSVFLDLTILLKTVPAVLGRRGAF